MLPFAAGLLEQTRRSGVLVLGLGLLLFPVAAMGADVEAGSFTAEPAAVVLIVADDLRADVISSYGGIVSTPAIDDLARRGCLFKRATCGYPICHVSRTEILTGRWMVVEAKPGRPIEFDSSWSVLPRFLSQHGWHPVHVGKWHCRGTPWSLGYESTESLFSSGSPRAATNSFDRDGSGRKVTGYTRWSFKTNANEFQGDFGIGLTPKTDRIITDGAIRAIGSTHESLFLHVNFTAPHDPLLWPSGARKIHDSDDIILPSNFSPGHAFDHGNQGGRDESIVPAPRTESDVLEQWKLYAAVTQSLDRQVGRIVEALRERQILDRSLIIFTSDHGLALGSHGLMGKQNQYEHTANVPLIIAGPGVSAGRRVEAQCGLRDLFPTVCELLGLETPVSIHGRSLATVLRGTDSEVHPAVYGYFKESQQMIRRPDGWKLIDYPKIDRRQLFHVASDPHEKKNLSNDPRYHEKLVSLQSQLDQWILEREAEATD